MESPKKARLCRIVAFFAGNFLEAMEERMNDDDLAGQTVNSGRDDKVKSKSLEPTTPCTRNRIQKKPGKELEEMRAGNGRNSMPEDRPGFLCAWDTCLIHGKVLDALGKKMNLAMFLAREALQQFSKRALRSMTAVNEGRNDGEAQVNASRAYTVEGARRCTVRKQLESAIGRGYQGEAKDRRSTQNPGRAASQ